jgi:hypothetical protein
MHALLVAVREFASQMFNLMRSCLMIVIGACVLN